MKKYFLLIAVVGLCLTSCKKCKDCEVKVEVLSTSTLTDADCAATSSAMGGSATTCQEYYDALLSSSLAPATEYCGDELEAAEATADVTTTEYRVYWDCK